MATEFDDANNSCPSRSHFKKTVSLQDWWLTKPQTDDDTKTLGVAGLTSPSLQSRAGRCFSSAPILKIYDLLELETVDGVCVILQGFINKDRTLESGFSSEVFDHFVFGFPPYWEEFSTSCPQSGSATECALRVNVAVKDAVEGNDNFHDSTHGKLLHHVSHTMDMGVQDSEDTVLSNITSNVHDASSLEASKELIIDDEYEVTCDRCPLTSKVDDDLSIVASPSKLLRLSRVSSRRMTRSMTKMDSSKNNLGHESLLHDIFSLDNVPLVDPENLGSSDIQMKDTNHASSDNKSVNVIGCDATNLLLAGSLELQNSRNCQKGNSSSSYGVKCESRKNILTSEGNPEEQNLQNVSSNITVEYGKGSTEAASYSKDMVLRSKSKQSQKDQNVNNVTEDQRLKSTQVGILSPWKTKDADVSRESQNCSDPLDLLSTPSVSVGGLVNATSKNGCFAPDVKDIKNDRVLSRPSMVASRHGRREIPGNFNSNEDVLHNEAAFNAVAASQQISSKEATITQSKPKRKLTSGRSGGEMAKRQHITSTKSVQSTSRLGPGHHTPTSAKKDSPERYVTANILSPESFSGKKSRSGRTLLPSLEFWRNQTVVYDADRRVAGVKDGTYVTLSSRDVSDNKKD